MPGPLADAADGARRERPPARRGALVPALLQRQLKVDDVVSSLLLNSVVFYAIMALIEGPVEGPVQRLSDLADRSRTRAELPDHLQVTRLHLGVLPPSSRRASSGC